MLDDPSLDIIEAFKSTQKLDPRINCLDDIAVLDLSESEWKFGLWFWSLFATRIVFVLMKDAISWFQHYRRSRHHRNHSISDWEAYSIRRIDFRWGCVIFLKQLLFFAWISHMIWRWCVLICFQCIQSDLYQTDNNALTGEIPTEIGNLGSLIDLALGEY